MRQTAKRPAAAPVAASRTGGSRLKEVVEYAPGKKVEVRSLGWLERNEFAAMTQLAAMGDLRARARAVAESAAIVLENALFDAETGAKVYPAGFAEGTSHELCGADSDTFDQLFLVALRLSGFDKGALEQAKNGSGASAGSSTASPAI